MEASLLSAIARHSVSFAVVGGHAVLVYSSPKRPDGTLRTIGDLDVLVSTEYVNLVRLSLALEDLGFVLSAQELSKKFEDGKLPDLHLGYSAQLFPKIKGVETTDVLKSSMHIASSFGSYPVISKPLLLVAKRAAGRPKDLGDVLALEASDCR